MLSNVIGTPFSENVLEQLYQRAARNSTTYRSNEEILFLANKSAWVRMISSVDISLDNVINTATTTAASTDLTKYYQRLGINDTSNYPDGTSLAKRWILEAGTSIYKSSVDPATGLPHMDIDLRSGIGEEGAYGLGGIKQQGYRPMPGLTSVQIDTAGRLGSLRIANINFKVWNMNQLNVIEALYFRLGYSMLLEWGHTQYFTNKSDFISSNIYGIDDPFTPNLRKENIQQQIAIKTRKTDGNYDGMLGIVSNFTWSFNQDGGYDCTVKLIGLGAVMDTMRINQAYTLPTGLIKKYKDAQKLIAAQIAAKAAADYAAAHPSPTPTGGGGGGAVVFTPPAPPKNAGELFAIAQTYDPTQASGITLDDFKNKFAFYSAIDYNWPQLYNSAQDFYFKSTNATNASELNSKTYGLFLGKQGYVNFRSRSPVNLIGSTLYLDMAAISSFYNAYRNINNDNLTQDSIDEFNASNYTDDAGTGTTVYLSEQISWALNRNLSNSFLDFTTVDKSNTSYGGMVSIVQAKVGVAGNTKLKDFFIRLDYPGVPGVPATDSATGNIIGTYTPSRTQVFKAIDDFFIGARATSVGVLANSKFKITNIETGTVQVTYNDKTLGYPPSLPTTANIPDNLKGSIIVTAKATITVKDVDPPLIQTIGGPGLGFQRANLPKKDITFDITIKFNNLAFIEAIDPPPPTTPATNTATTGNAGNTNGATNTANTDQTNEAFESALTAMLAYVKTVTQAGNTKNLKVVGLPKPFDLVGATKKFYQDGILHDVDFTPQVKPFVPVIQTASFDLTKYAQKGFNASLMANPEVYGSIPPVDFSEMSRSYLIQYGQGGQASTDIAASRVYITLGYLLAFLNNMCLIYDNTKDLSTTPQANPGGTGKDKRPYVYIDFNPETNFCLTSPQQLSIDPLKCLIPFAGDDKDYAAIYQPEMFKALTKPFKATENYVSSRLPEFRTSSKDAGRYQGKIMNILLDVDYLIQTAHNFATSDPEHSVNLKRYLEAIMLDVNKAVGNFNIFRVAYLDESNTIQIRDDQWTPNPGSNQILDRDYYKKNFYHFQQVQGIYGGADITSLRYGQLPIFGALSIARSFQFKTNLSTKLSSMIAISAQAETGSVNAKDPSPLAHLNEGYVDRYKPRIQNPSAGAAKTTSKKDPDNNDEAAANAFNTHIKSVYGNLALNADVIETAKNYYIERSALVKTGDPITSAAPFIPADLEITIDGIGGIIMGQAFTIPEERMPMTLRGMDGVTKVGFIVAGLTHTLDNNEWLTKIKGQMIKLRDSSSYGSSAVIAQVQNIPSAPGGSAGGGVVGQPATDAECHPPYRGYEGSADTVSKTIRDIYIPARDAANLTISKGLILLMTAQTQHEGFKPGTKSYRTNNPGNIGNTDSGAIVTYSSLTKGIQAQQTFYNDIFSGGTRLYKPSDTLYKYLSQYAPACYHTRPDRILVKGTNDPTDYTNAIINWFKGQGYNITADTTLAEIKALA